VTKYQISAINSCWEKCLSHYWWQKSDIWSQTAYRYPISWEAFLDPLDSYFLFADFVDFYTHLTYTNKIFHRHLGPNLLIFAVKVSPTFYGDFMTYHRHFTAKKHRPRWFLAKTRHWWTFFSNIRQLRFVRKNLLQTVWFVVFMWVSNVTYTFCIYSRY
jgi:hypothetical protein